jgi:predicted nucleic acid-binding protein
MKDTVYIETSVVSYLTARPSRSLRARVRQEITREWWDTAARRFDLFVSEAVLAEAVLGDVEAAEKRLAVLRLFAKLALNDDCERLAEAYVRELAIPEKSIRDATHLAVATVHRMDYLVTWNCTHLANGVVIRKFLAWNAREGRPSPTICTSEELLES